jgi:hypothetical protein
MQLTNYSFLSSRLDHISSGAARKVAMQRISSGNRLENGKTDAGALSASLRLRSSQLEMNRKMGNVQNALSFLQTQEAAIGSAMSILDRISELKTLFEDPTKSDSDRMFYAYLARFRRRRLDLARPLNVNPSREKWPGDDPPRTKTLPRILWRGDLAWSCRCSYAMQVHNINIQNIFHNHPTSRSNANE